MAKTKGTSKSTGSPDGTEAVPHISLKHLHLDKGNPRLGERAGKAKSETELLDWIVNAFGIDDILSSIAVNGFFGAEPLIGVRGKNSEIRIIEGNRRLVACLILAADERASHQSKRTADFQALQAKHHQAAVTEVPVLVFDEGEYSSELLSYLGVRHLAGLQPWDSYAKAAWVARILDEGNLKLDDVSQMTGDQHRTVARLLEGYYFVNQLQKTGRFNPAASYRRGRGSNTEYPFSWVYTALGFRPIREWLDLDDINQGPKELPVKSKHLDKARDLMLYLFGDKLQERQPAITDSRQIADLAMSLSDPKRRQMLGRGKTVDEVAEMSEPVEDRLSKYIFDAEEALQKVVVILSQEEVSQADLKRLDEVIKGVRKLAGEIFKRYQALAGQDADE
jgi:hypothetical protein